jgi:hypothetical protein
MNFLFAMMMNYWTISSIEKHFENREPDLVTMLGFLAITVMLFGWLASEYMVLQSSFIFSIMYVWSKFIPDQPMQIWGIPLKSG